VLHLPIIKLVLAYFGKLRLAPLMSLLCCLELGQTIRAAWDDLDVLEEAYWL